MTETYTENLADILKCARERNEFRKILNAWDANGLPENFDENNVRPAFNRNSGNVFLVNGDYQVAMLNGDKLEEFYSTPYEGHEGFISDLMEIEPDTMNEEDVQYIVDIIVNNNLTDNEIPKSWKDIIYK